MWLVFLPSCDPWEMRFPNCVFHVWFFTVAESRLAEYCFLHLGRLADLTGGRVREEMGCRETATCHDSSEGQPPTPPAWFSKENKT